MIMKEMKESKPSSRGGRIKNILQDSVLLILGSVLFALSMQMFLLPSQTVIGGVTGISTILNILFKTPVGLMIILINIPLVLINALKFGFRFMIKTILGIACTSLATDLLTFLKPVTDDRLLCALFGGITMGASLGFLFSRGFTSGGTDLIACLVKLKIKRFSSAQIIFVTDALIVICSCILLKNFSNFFFSLIAIGASSLTIDYVSAGISRAKLAMIICDKTDEVSEAILKDLRRGTTLLMAKGGFTLKERPVILCVVKKSEIYELKQVVNRACPNAFLIFSDATEVKGKGFESESLF